MLGQGRPPGDFGALCAAMVRCARILLSAVMLLAVSHQAFAQTGRRASSSSDPLQLRLTIKWGQKTPVAWRGTIETSSGAISEMKHRGHAADGAASYRLRDGRIEVHELTPRAKSELEILVDAPRDANLVVSLQPGDGEQESRETAIPLAMLIAKPAQLDAKEGGPWLSVSRTPGDNLRIHFDNDRRVYVAGDSTRFDIEPHEVLPEGAGATLPLQLRVDMRLVRSRTQEEVWYERREIESDELGKLPRLEGVEFLLPREEGAYELIIKLENRRFLASGFAPIEQREPIVVMADIPPSGPMASWRTAMEIDPTVRSWWDSLRVLPQIKGIPGLSTSASPMASTKPGVVSRDGRKWAALPAGAWQAIPLSSQTLGDPHIVQIELPEQGEPRPRLLLLEQHANGKIAAIGLNADGLIPPALVVEKPGTKFQQLVYWPTTPTVWLVVVAPPHDRPKEQHSEASAESRFGSVKLFAGPSQLAPSSASSRIDRGRVLALELPLQNWRELFGGDLSNPTGAAEATYGASVRLANYLKSKGYNACRLGVADQGQSLYPSTHFDRLPEVNERIDSMDLVFRCLAREGLHLIAEFGFNAPLAELETLREDPDEIVPGADLLVSNGVAARQRALSPTGVGPIYNPLDSLVQAAIRSPLEDFLDRYAHHDSFGGVVLRLTPDCYTRLPHEEWGKDSPTLERFAANYQQNKLDPRTRPNQRATYTQPDRRDAWLAWRGEQLAIFYKSIQDRVSESRPEARLYLPLNGLLEGEMAEDRIRAWIANKADLSDLWLSAGIEPIAFKTLKDTVFLRPTHLRTHADAQANVLALAENSEAWKSFQEAFWITGACARTSSVPVALAGFAERGPFRGTTMETYQSQLAVDSDLSIPVLEGLVAADPFALTFDSLAGGAQPRAMNSDWIEIFRRLPPVMMQPVAPKGSQGDSKLLPNTPVVIRQATNASRTWFYAVNPCPFPVTITVDLQAPSGVKLDSLTASKLPPPQTIGQAVTWSYQLAPRQVIGGVMNSPKAKLLSFATSVQRETMIELSQELGALQSRLKVLEQTGYREYSVLQNPEFEVAEGGASIPTGWQLTKGEEDSASLTRPGASSAKCLQISSRGELVSIRSAYFAAPQSKRLLWSVFLRTDAGARAPDVKLVIEGEDLEGKPFIKRATVNKFRTIDENWKHIPFPLDFIPEVKHLRVGIDVASRGQIYVDSASLADFWCSEAEVADVKKQLVVASHALEKGRVTQAQRLLTDFWPNYLREQVDLPSGGRLINQVATKPAEKPPQQKPERTIQDRVKEMLPLPKGGTQRR